MCKSRIRRGRHIRLSKRIVAVSSPPSSLGIGAWSGQDVDNRIRQSRDVEEGGQDAIAGVDHFAHGRRVGGDDPASSLIASRSDQDSTNG